LGIVPERMGSDPNRLGTPLDRSDIHPGVRAAL
jgi:hypothetical protein